MTIIQKAKKFEELANHMSIRECEQALVRSKTTVRALESKGRMDLLEDQRVIHTALLLRYVREQ